jgi:hypothetical protein
MLNRQIIEEHTVAILSTKFTASKKYFTGVTNIEIAIALKHILFGHLFIYLVLCHTHTLSYLFWIKE